MKTNLFVSFAILGLVLVGCTSEYDGNLKITTPFTLTQADGNKINISVNQSASILLSNKVQDDGTYHDALVLNGSKFYFSVAKENVDPSGNHAQSDASVTGQGIGLDADITPNAPVNSVVNTNAQFCTVTNTCWYITSKQSTVNGTTTTTYDWAYGFNSACPGSQNVQVETDYFADQLNVKFTDSSGKLVANFSGYGEESFSNKVLSQTACALNEHYVSVDFRPNYVPNGPRDYR